MSRRALTFVVVIVCPLLTVAGLALLDWASRQWVGQ